MHLHAHYQCPVCSFMIIIILIITKNWTGSCHFLPPLPCPFASALTCLSRRDPFLTRQCEGETRCSLHHPQVLVQASVSAIPSACSGSRQHTRIIIHPSDPLGDETPTALLAPYEYDVPSVPASRTTAICHRASRPCTYSSLAQCTLPPRNFFTGRRRRSRQPITIAGPSRRNGSP